MERITPKEVEEDGMTNESLLISGSQIFNSNFDSE